MACGLPEGDLECLVALTLANFFGWWASSIFSVPLTSVKWAPDERAHPTIQFGTSVFKASPLCGCAMLYTWWLLVGLCLLCYCGTCRGYLIWLSPGATLLCLLLLAIACHFGRACLMAVLSAVSWWARRSGYSIQSRAHCKQRCRATLPHKP